MKRRTGKLGLLSQGEQTRLHVALLFGELLNLLLARARCLVYAVYVYRHYDVRHYCCCCCGCSGQRLLGPPTVIIQLSRALSVSADRSPAAAGLRLTVLYLASRRRLIARSSRF